MDPLFSFYNLNEIGQSKINDISSAFSILIEMLRRYCPENTREFSLVKTKLEEACFFAKKSISTQITNQVTE